MAILVTFGSKSLVESAFDVNNKNISTKMYRGVTVCHFVQEFGANSDSETARYHYLKVPFVARYVRLHPTQWKRRISMRVGLVGCPQTGLFFSRCAG